VSFIVGILVTYLSYWGVLNNTFTQALYANSWLTAFLISGVLYTILMVAWVIPKYQKFLKGNISKGYISEETKKIFES
ncbi:MAG: hypothetical protein QXX17_04715, partial [Conexivisphaerales archaeon]